MTMAGRIGAIARASAGASNTSTTMGVTPAASRSAAFLSERVVPNTSWPASSKLRDQPLADRSGCTSEKYLCHVGLSCVLGGGACSCVRSVVLWSLPATCSAARPGRFWQELTIPPGLRDRLAGRRVAVLESRPAREEGHHGPEPL